MKEFKEYEEFKEGKLFCRMSADSAGRTRRMNPRPRSTNFYNWFFWRLPEGLAAVKPHLKIE
jgi:hypothetical protein